MSTKDLIGGLLAGAAIGVAIGILLAPKSGRETREDIVTGSRKLTDSLKGSVEDSLESLKGKFNSTVEDTVKRGRDIANNLGEKAKV